MRSWLSWFVCACNCNWVSIHTFSILWKGFLTLPPLLLCLRLLGDTNDLISKPLLVRPTFINDDFTFSLVLKLDNLRCSSWAERCCSSFESEHSCEFSSSFSVRVCSSSYLSLLRRLWSLGSVRLDVAYRSILSSFSMIRSFYFSRNSPAFSADCILNSSASICWYILTSV